MKKQFILHGVWIGTICAVLGSVVYGVLLGVFFSLDAGTDLASIGLSMMGSLIPGALGGAYLAHWLEKSERTQREITCHGLLIGILSGLLPVLVLVRIVLDFGIDVTIFSPVMLAPLVAAGMGWFAVLLLAKHKEKIIFHKPLQQVDDDGTSH